MNGLEEGGDHGQQATEICANPGTQGKETSEQCADGKEESDEHQGEHEPGYEEIVAGVNELGWDIHFGAEVFVPWRIEGKSRVYVGVFLVAADCT